jgi:hypothetical protein
MGKRKTMMTPKLGIWIDAYSLDQEEIPQARLDALAKAGFDVQTITLSPHREDRVCWQGGDVDLITVWGSIAFVRQLAARAVADTPPIFEFFTPELHYYHRYQHYFAAGDKFNQDGIMLPFGSLQGMTFDRASALVIAPSGVVLKPDNGLKVAEVYTCPTAETWVEAVRQHVAFNRTDPTALFWLAPYRTIEAEYRCLVQDGRVVDVANYAGPELNDTPALLAFANKVLANVELDDPLFVLDVVRSEGRWFVMELNCASTSGWYTLDVEKCAHAWWHALAAIYADRYRTEF